jgi:hypothetical protein
MGRDRAEYMKAYRARKKAERERTEEAMRHPAVREKKLARFSTSNSLSDHDRAVIEEYEQWKRDHGK